MKNILIPTDFSDDAWNATRYAIEFFGGEACTFHLLNVYTPAISSNRFMAATFQGKALEDGARRSELGLTALVKRIKSIYHNLNHSFAIISSFNLLEDEIKNTIENKDIDLIVTGNRGASGMEDVFMGRNTVRIIKSVKNCPILTIPQHFEFIGPSKIVFATDFNRFYTPSELGPLIGVAKAFDAVIHIVHQQGKNESLDELQQFNLRMLHKYLGNVTYCLHSLSDVSGTSDTGHKFYDLPDVHLLAMFNYQHSYLTQLTCEPEVKRVVFQTRKPLLILPELDMGTSYASIELRGNVISLG